MPPVIGDAWMLSPNDTLAIGLIVLAVVQAAKLMGMPPEWSPPIAVFLGGVIGVASGLSNHFPYETWLTLFYDGAVGGLSGAGVYGVGKGMGELTSIQKKKASDRARLARMKAELEASDENGQEPVRVTVPGTDTRR